MGRSAKWRSTRKPVDFAPTTMTTTTIEPDGAPVLLPESARAGERRRLKPSPLDLSTRTAAPEISQSRSILSVSKAPLCVEAAAHAASPAMYLRAIFESPVCKGGNERVKRAPPPGLSATLTLDRKS